MTKKPDDNDNAGGRARKKGFWSITMALDALLSVTFLVLAAYIGLYTSTAGGDHGRDLFRFSLLGAYGIWRAIRGVIRYRQKDEKS